MKQYLFVYSLTNFNLPSPLLFPEVGQIIIDVFNYCHAKSGLSQWVMGGIFLVLGLFNIVFFLVFLSWVFEKPEVVVVDDKAKNKKE